MNQLQFFTLSAGREERGAGCAEQGTGIAHQGLRAPLTEVPAASPTSLPPSLWLLNQPSLPQKHPVFTHCKKYSLYFGQDFECEATRQALTAKAGREQLAPAARSGSGGRKPCSALEDQPLRSPGAG